MDGSVKSIVDAGTHGIVVEIECHTSNNLPAIVIVGSANKAVDEAKERVRAAFGNSSLQLPRKRITINLAPADLPKADSSFDLAIAIAILKKSSQIPANTLQDFIVIGELGLNGILRPCRGIIGKILAARKMGFTRFVIPTANLRQAELVPHVTLLPASNLKQLYDYLTTGVGAEEVVTGDGIWDISDGIPNDTSSLDDIVGQEAAKRALVIAAAGGHNLFLSGPPGTGKSMLARAIPSILPDLTREEVLEVTQLHSLATSDYEALVTTRPFRAPHHSASLVAIIGGGNNLRPGEVSLSHRGVLFLDEIPEFNRSTLEALRQPLEDRIITVARAKDSATYPANFILVGTANPCPCGYYGSSKPCRCLPHQILHYQQRISGPILDRIDLHIVVKDVEHKHLLEAVHTKQSERAKAQVMAVRAAQARRYQNASRLNGDMSNRDIKLFAHLRPTAKDILDTAAQRMSLSARSYMKTIKVARTIADLEGSTAVEHSHIAEALRYRYQEHAGVL